MTRITIPYILVLLSMLILSACNDSIDYSPDEIPEGESMVQFKLNFKDYTPALESRSAGNAIKSINRLWIVIYKSDGTFYHKRDITGEFTLRPNTRPDGKPQGETETGHAEFKMTLPNGRYRIYAVANMDISGLDVSTEDKLRDVRAEWDTGDISRNAEMFGWFSNTGETVPNQGFVAEDVVVAPGKTTIHAWLYRLASKVTVAFDGSGLKDGVSIYLKKVRIRNIPRSCGLGVTNKATSKDDVYDRGEEVVYSESTDFNSDHPTILDNIHPYYPRVNQGGTDGVTWVPDPDRHSETNPNSLFFYENEQGDEADGLPDKRQVDENGDGILDELYPYEGLAEKATYIEVETHYVSTNPERPGVCNITYRFMLGQDVVKDYNATRNSHYKLTLHLRGFADEPDWRIDYVTRLNVTDPKRVNYLGKYFEPDAGGILVANHGNTFIDENYINVESFMYVSNSWETREKIDFNIEYRDKGSKEFSPTPPAWLDKLQKIDKGNGVFDLKITYKNPFEEVDINQTLQSRDSKPGVYDLATKGGTDNINSANCYIVDSKGTYQFPLIYGNAVTGGVTNEAAFKYQGFLDETSNPILRTLKNYKDQGITKPYILEDIYGNADNVPANINAKLVWQDENNLVSNIQFVQAEYNGLGAIRFTVGANIKEGNAVIALTDPSGTVMWSWHIWVTAIDLSKTVTLNNDQGQQFVIMPVNLGWCSGGTKIRYYERHECEVKITQSLSSGDGVSQTVKIVQEPHISLPRGNNPYFQWGRKDPFVAANGGNKTNKTRYTTSGSLTTNPEFMYPDEANIKETKDATADLIRNPDKWMNCKKTPTGAEPGSGKPTHTPIDKIYLNLWDNRIWHDGDEIVCKTVYDPCPAGYHVSSLKTFRGFVDSGQNFAGSDENPASKHLYAVTDENNNDVPDVYKTGVFEFYADRDTKLISIGIPQNGYRDWADLANVLSFGNGNIWLAQSPLVSWGNPGYTAYDLEMYRNTSKFDHSYIRPWDNFNSNDGFAIRPTISKQ